MNSFILNNKMAIQANSIPHFSGKKELSLQDLDTLAHVVQAHGMTTEYVPAGMPRGRRQYTGANYNLSQFVDECNGETAAPDKPGTLASVQYRSTAAPYIDNGNMVLPLAHDCDPAEDSSEPAEQATGGICSINVGSNLKRPLINRGDIQLPLAHSDWGEAEGPMATPGLLYAVVVHDDCDGAISAPYIEQGVLHLLAPGGGGGGDGGITSCIFSGTVTAPTVKGTQLQLPYAEQTNEVCFGKATPVYTPGVLKHVSFAPDNCNACGYYPWIADGECYIPTPIVALGGEDGKSALCNHLINCEYAPVTLSSCRLPDGTMLYLQGWTERNGQQLRLKLTTDNAYYY